jgi:hypothetical protein
MQSFSFLPTSPGDNTGLASLAEPPDCKRFSQSHQFGWSQGCPQRQLKMESSSASPDGKDKSYGYRRRIAKKRTQPTNMQRHSNSAQCASWWVFPNWQKLSTLEGSLSATPLPRPHLSQYRLQQGKPLVILAKMAWKRWSSSADGQDGQARPIIGPDCAENRQNGNTMQGLTGGECGSWENRKYVKLIKFETPRAHTEL